jgi:hypothetical protein
MLPMCLFGCCIGFTYMLQLFYLDVASIYNGFQVLFYLDVASIYNGFQVFSCIFTSVSDACLKCFICLQTYVTIVASGCFQSRSMLHLPPRFLLSRLGVTFSFRPLLGICYPPLPLSRYW